MSEIPVAKACPAWMSPELCEWLLAALEAFMRAEVTDDPEDYILAARLAAPVIAEVRKAKGQ
jgi:hypothetical protein